MEPIEINAGGWYLRALRADERVDDRPALADGGITDPDYVSQRSAQWHENSVYSWAVCQPNTGELLAEVVLTPLDSTALLTGWARDGHTEALTTAADAVTRFAEGALGLVVVEGQTN
ncbi:hypothetical protein ACH49M_11590 [Rhodococcus qingshengii]|jgi:hypothetical protein|uniref:Uncharacterized protein n=5 Tax=Bacillati TaxID=1783272 RepID=A0A0C2VQC3_RHOER|nr:MULTISPECIES: hypothetical protein [Rhodococcus]EEN89290.1 hypothetical protein RHOER0001_4244 [Rhodococcus erythropolis SK121]ERB53889.1 hypothetical protein N806_22395 [Rhodococcus sp. P27]MCD2154663.1 hypothetical protein [Rhodococcus cerastii]NHE62952.1 hypothetical protein [Rhodococcus sp. D-46]OCC21485.1 hypothetical protein AS590_18110 [Prescottella equi]